ncbi:NAD-dependent epimerase/dehydratase family protein [Paracoccus yeei]|nr:NAD-dependent epimerase/dehydratase family protein [Paracoccus yeei]OWJ96016.1 NAD-dependent epimerase [Paracoccus yeei]
MTRTLVIGGCGFIGSHIVDKLLERGHLVRVLDMRPELYRLPLLGVEYVMGSFCDEATLEAALQDVDSVVHTASTTVPSTANLDPIHDIGTNLISTVRLLQVMREKSIKRLVFLSSGGTVYGIPQADMVTEDHPQNPISSYGIVKLAIERYLHMEQHLHGLEYVALRASNPYGPRQGQLGLQGIIGNYLWKVSKGEQIEVWGDGSIIRDFIHVQDLAELAALTVKAPICGFFNAGSGQGTSVNQIVSLTAKVTGQNLQPIYKPGRGFDVPRIILDITRIRQATDWSPVITLEEGFRDSWNWIHHHKQVSAVA